MEKLHPGAKWLFRIHTYASLLFLSIFFGVFIFQGIIFALSDLAGNFSFAYLLFIPISGLIFTIILGEVYARLAYKYWKYEFAKDSLKIERGIIWRKMSNVPYNRVQNVDIRRGILARILGFSTVDLQTAGAAYSGGRGMPRSEGHLPAIDVKHAEQIQDFVLKKISHSKGQGM